MTYQKTAPQSLQIRPIARKRLQSSLMATAVLAALLAGCGPTSNRSSSTNTNPQSDQMPTSQTPASSTPSEQLQDPDEPIQAVFYQTTEQCQDDIQQQQQTYQGQLTAYDQGELDQKPTAPTMEVDDCEPQMLAAQEEHNRTAPTYSTLEECQADGTQCEAIPAEAQTGDQAESQAESQPESQAESQTESQTTGYRPRYGGSYFYPFGGPNFILFSHGGTNRLIHQPYPVYQSNTPGTVVTPLGQTVPQTTSGQVTVPRHTSFTSPQPSTGSTSSTSTNSKPGTQPANNSSTSVSTPSRPASTPARGTVTGRGNQGFGSTYKGTGRGGK